MGPEFPPGPVLEIEAGVVLGPAVLNPVQPDATVQALSIIALSFLVFLAGPEMSWAEMSWTVPSSAPATSMTSRSGSATCVSWSMQ
ncbi:hypothetical protein StrepF001_42390 [Streptomyces sp. F001]|nr:hypothetical protein StrepF001_42390 [Streptomyces sp. F001]